MSDLAGTIRVAKTSPSLTLRKLTLRSKLVTAKKKSPTALPMMMIDKPVLTSTILRWMLSTSSSVESGNDALFTVDVTGQGEVTSNLTPNLTLISLQIPEANLEFVRMER